MTLTQRFSDVEEHKYEFRIGGLAILSLVCVVSMSLRQLWNQISEGTRSLTAVRLVSSKIRVLWPNLNLLLQVIGVLCWLVLETRCCPYTASHRPLNSTVDLLGQPTADLVILMGFDRFRLILIRF